MGPAEKHPVDDLVERIARAEPRLDDLARQRVLARVHAGIAADERAARSRARYLRIGAPVAAVAVLLLFWLRSDMSEPVARRPAQAERVAPPAVQRALPLEPTPEVPILVPYLVAGTEAPRAAELLEHGVNRLALGAGERVLALLANRARVTIVGPARLSVRAEANAHVELELSQGTLLGDYDHDQGGLLTIRSPGAITEVVGTLFMVRADDAASRVAVARGAVRVRSGSRVVALGSSQVLRDGAHTPAPISATDASLLRAHEQSYRPPSGEHGVVGLVGPELRAEIAGQLLAQTPLWVRMPVGTYTITLRDRTARTQELRTSVQARQRTELVVAPARAASRPPVEASAAPSPLPAAEPAPAPSAADLYRSAELAMRSDDHARAAELLEQLVRTHADASSIDLALYELAKYALGAEDYGRARSWLAQLEGRGARPALREPAHFLRCRIARAGQASTDYLRCLEQFQALFPDSSRRAEVAAALAVLRARIADGAVSAGRP